MVTCATIGDHVELHLASKPVEWKNVTDVHSHTWWFSTNGDEHGIAGLAPPNGDGATAYEGSSAVAPSYPLYYAERIDTNNVSRPIYSSALVASCTADGVGAAAVYHVPEPGAAATASVAIACLLARRRAA